MENKRGRSCTFLELACAVDILTGGMCGPKDASIKEKTDITKKVWNIIHGSFSLKGKIQTVNELPTTAPLGFPKMPGVSRRPNLGRWPGLAVAISAVIRYAKNEPEGLKTKLPRVTWVKYVWTPSVMGDIMHRLVRKRKAMTNNGRCPDMPQRSFRLKKGAWLQQSSS